MLHNIFDKLKAKIGIKFKKQKLKAEWDKNLTCKIDSKDHFIDTHFISRKPRVPLIK